MKLVGVIDEDPFDQSTWSGLSYYFFSALNNNGWLCDAVSAKPAAHIRNMYKLLSFYPTIKKWKFKYHLNINYYKQMTKVALEKIDSIENNKYDAILQVGAWYDLTGVKGKPTFSYHDGNLAALLNSPYGYPKINNKYIRKALEYERYLYGKINHIFPMSMWLADSFIKDFNVPIRKITPVGAGINLPFIKDAIGKSYDEPNILFVGRDFQRKGGKYLIAAFELVRKEIKEANLTIIGPDKDQVPTLEGIRKLGFVTKKQRAGLEILLNEYLRASVFVMPSLYEPFGVVFAEAMAHRLPCIGTSICAMNEIIDNGVNGYLVQPGNEKALAEAIIKLLKDPFMCRDFGERSYVKYLKNYTWDAVVSKIIDKMTDVIQ